MGSRRWLAAVTVAAGLLVGACGDGEDRPGQVTEEGGSASGSGTASGSTAGAHEKAAFGESEATTKVTVSMVNFAFNGIPGTVKGPKVFFTATNGGSVDHELVVLDPAGKELGEAHGIAPGKTGTLAVELAPGTYSVECHVKEGDRVHSDLGMKATLTVE